MTQEMFKVVIDMDKLAQRISSFGAALTGLHLNSADKAEIKAQLEELVKRFEELKANSIARNS